MEPSNGRGARTRAVARRRGLFGFLSLLVALIVVAWVAKPGGDGAFQE